MAMATIVVRIPFEVHLEGYPEGTTVEMALEMERKALENMEFSVDEFIDPNYPITVEVEQE